MNSIQQNGYVAAAVLFDNDIREMRKHVEFEKFLCRLLIDNDDTREMKQNTEEHQDAIHRITYNNSAMDRLTEFGKHEALGQSNYKPTPSGEF